MKTQEYTTRGKLGEGTIWKHTTGKREVTLHLWCGKTITTESQRVDLETAKTKDLKDAVNLACHKTGYLPLFEKLELSGSKALVICYRRPAKPEQGYATIIKKGTPSLKFSLDRIDLHIMKATTVEEALRKAAYETGAIRISS